MADIELYWSPGSCSRVTLIALEEIGEPFRLIYAGGDRAANPGYLAINRKGKVPALVVDGDVLTETPAILTYLARTHPHARLLPNQMPAIEIDALATMAWLASGVHPAVTRLRFPSSVSDDPSGFEAIRRVADANLRMSFEIIEERLAGRDWLYDDWSIVDGYLLWVWFRATGSGMDGTPFPRCADHALRCEQRPTVAAVLDREESEMRRLLAEGLFPLDRPPYQVGRAPRVGQSPT